ncbi:hypothetical protein [Nostoc sp.]|uniref:hypothetical protein n=1 Tax=Nostoc sp. TaxID=1180 RepID=UPI002FF686AD
MTLPDDFSSTEHLQDTIKKQHNKNVLNYFKDLGDTWEPNVSTGRYSLRTACYMQEGDSAADTNLRIKLLYDILGFDRSDLAVYHGSLNDIEAPVTGHPKVCFYFSQDRSSVTINEPFVDMECSFRLMNETPETFTKSNAVTLATKIHTHFIEAGKGITFVKGKHIYYYKDKSKGYELRLYGNSDTDSVDLIRRLLECQDVVYNEDNLTESVPTKSNTTTPGTHTVYGRTEKKKRYRPIETVRFRYAYVEIPGRKQNVFLLDTTHKHSALVPV